MSLAEVESIFIPILLYPESVNLLEDGPWIECSLWRILGLVDRLKVACVLTDNDRRQIAIALLAV